MKRAMLPILLSMLPALVLASCSSGGDDAAPPPGAPTATATVAEELTFGKLALMPLTIDDFGAEFAALGLDNTSGYQTSDEMANNTIDPRDTPADFKASDWLISYKLAYQDQSLTAYAAGAGIVAASTQLDLFENDTVAADYIASQLADVNAQTGSLVRSGTTLTNSAHFQVSAGDQAFGLTEELQFGTTPVFTWVSGFRQGRVVAVVTVSRTDNADQTARMRQLAEILDQHVDGVIAGSISGSPLPLPTRDPNAPGETSRPPVGPYPDKLALLVEDLPLGSTAESSGYVKKEDRVSFKSKFNVSLPEAGSGPQTAEHTVDSWPSDSAAMTNTLAMKGLYLGDSAPELFAGLFAGQPFPVTNVTVVPADISPAGDDSFALKVGYEVAFGRMELEIVVFRVGSIVSTLVFSEFEGDLDQTFVDGVTAGLTARIGDTLAAQ